MIGEDYHTTNIAERERERERERNKKKKHICHIVSFLEYYCRFMPNFFEIYAFDIGSFLVFGMLSVCLGTIYLTETNFF